MVYVGIVSVRRLGIVTAVVAIVALGASAPGAAAASLYQPDCIHGAPAGWVTAPAQPSDQFVVWAPPAYGKLAEDAAKTIRGKNFFGYYESKLNIAHLGYGNQAASGRFEIFLDPDFRSALKNADGITAKRCENPAREAIDIYAGIGDHEVFHAAIAHELFHAAQSQLAGDFDDNWWFEATATWAETRFGYSTPVPEDFSSSVTDHPGLPMDAFSQPVDGADAHEYGAWTFVGWLFSRHKIDWHELRDSFGASAHSDAAPVLASLLSKSGDKLGDEVATYWADHTNAKPQFGPTAKMTEVKAGEDTSNDEFPLADPLGARILRVKPTSKVNQLVVSIHRLPAGADVYIRLGKDKYWHLDAGRSFEETFCRSGALKGSLELPSTGDVRIAVTSLAGAGKGEVKLKLIGDHKSCPKQIEIQPGLAVGQLHVGMTEKEAAHAAIKHKWVTGNVDTPYGRFRSGVFLDAPGAPVIADFHNGRAALLYATGNRFRTSDGLTMLVFDNLLYNARPDLGPIIIPGSTLDEFGGQCHDTGSQDPPGRYCVREGPKTRYTFAVAGDFDPCPPIHLDNGDVIGGDCGYPTRYYIGAIGVTNKAGLAFIRAVLEAVN